jgi:predicted HTH transcriptional regulator
MQSSQPKERVMLKNTLHVSESQTAEFKLIWKDEYLKTICAMANSEVPIKKPKTGGYFAK